MQNRIPISSEPLRYMRHLDGLRAFAVAGVLVEHWFPGHGTLLFSPGKAGVLLFFVLSGFLISGILFRARVSEETTGRWPAGVLRAFYARRFLRIFPLYYAVVIAAAIVGVGETRHVLPWLLTYSQNVLFSVSGSWFGNEIAHLWTLAVEEQFYLLWPLVALSLPRRAIVRVLIAAIVFAPLARIAHAGLAAGFPDIQMHENLDSLGAGALLAAFGPESEQGRGLGRSGLKIGLSAYILLTFAWMAADAFDYAQKVQILGAVFAQLRAVSMIGVFVWLIQEAALGFSRRGQATLVGRTLSCPPVVYLGRISYGIYILHLFAPWVWERLGFHMHAPSVLLTNHVARLPFLLALTVGGAALSWQLIEKPLNGLKSRFPYVRERLSEERRVVTL